MSCDVTASDLSSVGRESLSSSRVNMALTISASTPSLANAHLHEGHVVIPSPEHFVLKGVEGLADYQGHIGVGGVVAPYVPAHRLSSGLGSFGGVTKVSSTPALQQLLSAGSMDNPFTFDDDMDRPDDAMWPTAGEGGDTFGLGLDEDEIGIDVLGERSAKGQVYDGFVQQALKTDALLVRGLSVSWIAWLGLL